MVLFLFFSSSVFHLPFCCLWYVPETSKKPVICVRVWSRARCNSAADSLKKGKEGLCCKVTAPSLLHPTARSKDSEQDEWWGDFSLRFLCKSILFYLFIQNLVWAENESEGGRSSIFAEEMCHSRNQTFFWHFIMDKKPCRSEVPGPWFGSWDMTLQADCPSCKVLGGQAGLRLHTPISNGFSW